MRTLPDQAGLRAALAMMSLFLGLETASSQEDLPIQITPAAVRQVKQATVHLRVTGAGGEVGEGSGFLAVEPGIVITNAHVVGMLNKKNKMPTLVEVSFFNGEVNEFKVVGKVLGVDQEADLAVIKVDSKNVVPLQLDLTDQLFETQKVYIFGFPFGEQLGKNITTSESSVSSLRKDGSGLLEKIQVNGGMHEGNSGGPVVNSIGRVIGVSVAIIRGTQINFAIPSTAVKQILEGRIQEVKVSELVLQNDDVVAPVSYRCLDPFKKIREMRVEVWTGKPSEKRKFSTQKAEPLEGDGPLSLHPLDFKDNVGSGKVNLPKAAAGQVVWIQPVLMLEKGEYRGKPLAYNPTLALKAVPADLTMKLANQKERTVHLKASQSLMLNRGKEKYLASDIAELDLLESFEPDPLGAVIRIGFGPLQLSSESRGRKSVTPPQVTAILNSLPPAFVVDETNKLRSRVDINLNPRANISPLVREQIGDYYTQICNGYESVHFALPNRQLSPQENWPVQVPMMFKSVNKVEIVDLVLNCTYEGMRSRNDENDALVTFQGRVQGRDARKDKVEGQVTGKFTFNSENRFINFVSLNIATELSSTGSDLQATITFDVELTRSEGNLKNIILPARTNPMPPPPKGGDTIASVLTAGDPLDTKFGARGSRMKIFPLLCVQGKNYTITLSSAAFDCYLRLLSPNGQVIAEDDDSGGNLNSRIIFTAPTTGVYRLVATALDGKSGAFQLNVLGEMSAAKNDKLDSIAKHNSELKADDPPDTNFATRGSRMKTYPLQCEQGKIYTITLNSNEFDSYLRLLSPNGRVVAEDDDSGGNLNSRIVFTATTTGEYRIVATSLNGKMGAFQLEILGEKKSSAKVSSEKADPNVKLPESTAFAKPSPSKQLTSYLKVDSAQGDYIGQGKTYEFTGEQITAKPSPRGIELKVDGWNLEIGAPNGQFLKVGEYLNAKRFPFSGDSPGLNFSGNGRGCNRLAGEFVVWELEIEGDRIVRLAIDFVQRCEERMPPLKGTLRINSNFE